MSQPDAPATIGGAIRAARLARGLSQSEVSAQMRPPLPYSCISRWERGAVPSLANLAALAAVLGPLTLPAPGGGVIRVLPPGAEDGTRGAAEALAVIDAARVSLNLPDYFIGPLDSTWQVGGRCVHEEHPTLVGALLRVAELRREDAED